MVGSWDLSIKGFWGFLGCDFDTSKPTGPHSPTQLTSRVEIIAKVMDELAN